MKRRTILFVMNAQTPDDQIAIAAEAAAQNDNHLKCLLLGAAPAIPVYAYGVPPYGGIDLPDNWNEMLAEARQVHGDRAKAIEALLAKQDASGEVQAILCATLDVKHIVAQLARVSDEALLAKNMRDTPDVMREAASGVLFHSPIAFRINSETSHKPDRVFVAWDSSEAAASATHAALPHLKDASEVVIACIDPVMSAERDGQDPGTDVATWLSHHGCNVTVSQFPSGGQNIGECIQDRAKEFGADLVVMGAYGHARMIQTVLGGTTRTMIEQTDLPVLFGH